MHVFVDEIYLLIQAFLWADAIKVAPRQMFVLLRHLRVDSTSALNQIVDMARVVGLSSIKESPFDNLRYCLQVAVVFYALDLAKQHFAITSPSVRFDDLEAHFYLIKLQINGVGQKS
jgi:hypothetical protein